MMASELQLGAIRRLMLDLDTCVLLAVLTPEAHTATATAFLAQGEP